MSWISATAIFFVIWWTTLFAILPLRINSAHEAGEKVEDGNDAGAPVAHGLKWKMMLTIIAAAVIFTGIHYVLVNNILETMHIPLMDNLPKL